jgi:hypothetical protein
MLFDGRRRNRGRPDWEFKDGHYRVRLENKWFDVPDSSLITEPNRAGRTSVGRLYS